MRNVYLCCFRPQGWSLQEVPARILVVLDVAGWRYQFVVKNTHIGLPCRYFREGGGVDGDGVGS